MIHYITTEGLGVPWVGNELRIVDAAGIPFRLHAMRAPKKTHFDAAWAKRLQSRAQRAIYPMPVFEFLIANILAPFRFRSRWASALLNALFAPRENLRARASCLWHFFTACLWAARLRSDEVSHIHAQWAFSSASIGMYGAWLLEKPFSFTGHAVDLTVGRVALKDKIRRARFIIAISQWHKDLYVREGAEENKVHIAYCGIYTDEMVPRSGEREPGPFHLLSSGRLIGKKGFDVLIDACAVLRDRGREFRCTIGGSGPLEAELRARIAERKLEGIVTMTGKALQQEAIPQFMHSGDAYTLACKWADDGDVDGLPQMLMEAMACGLPAVSTRLVGIPDLIEHEKTGLLADSDSVEQLAEQLDRLMQDAALRERLARDGRAIIFDVFDITKSLSPLLNQFRAALGRPHVANDKVDLHVGATA